VPLTIIFGLPRSAFAAHPNARDGNEMSARHWWLQSSTTAPVDELLG
jgi:hypothetical protein